MRRSRILLFSALGLLMVAAFAACRTTPTLTQSCNPGEVWVEGHFRNGLEITGIFNRDGTLDRSPFLGHYFRGTRIMLTNLVSRTSANGYPEVQATIRNTGRDRQRLQYRYIWYDSDGMEVAQGTGGWNSETIEPDETRTLDGVARGSDVRRFTLFVREYQPQR